ncbi:tetratricopeptide repeat protein [Rhodopila sp.]|jgi:predicted O-linked N-acetylglucosamine transferase (SPINDLY family)|uniref:tetratricopeptide repeat protein n=1 Tax=Rhodopila sp. TaxID=2480087 RepID=UPI002BB5099F|nr:tetratricopeptide repeat protein [Rhodopila sp.]HVZ08735.1 tetratricopeptide repeat protein [Rhodopila sp.]
MTARVPWPDGLELDPPDREALASAGVAALAEGRFADALAILRRAASPGRPPTDGPSPEGPSPDGSSPSGPSPSGPSAVTLLNLAIAEDKAGDRAKARTLMRQIAIRLPDWDEPFLRLAESLRADNDPAGAEEAYRHVLTLRPNRPAALIALGGLLVARNAAKEARDLLLRACGSAPGNPEAWFVLGLALQMTDAPSQALSAFMRAQALAPDNLTYVLCGLDAALRADEAEAELARLTRRCADQPLNHVPLTGRAVLLDKLDRPAEAIDLLEAATILAPDAPEPWRLLGGLLARTTQAARAESVLRRAAELAPDDPRVANDHAAVLMRLHRHAEARRILRSVLDRSGPHPAPLCNLANATVCLGLQEDAVAVARQAIALAPEASLPRRALCNVLPYCQDTTPDMLLAALADCSAILPRGPRLPLTNARDPERRLRLGLLSGSFRAHPVGWLTVAGIEQLDPDRFDITCFTRTMAGDDPLTRRFRTAAGAWVEVDRLDDAALTDVVRARGIDVLIDLGGYGEGGRMSACANRLAPVQIKWVGMQNHSTGLPEMDWFLTDRWETPDGFDRYYTEKLLRLPDGYVCYSPPSHAPDTTPLPALANGFITFGCFNNLAKVTPLVIETWGAILRQVPGSRLLLKSHPLTDPAVARRVLDAFAAQGIDAGRIALRGASGHRAFLRELAELDIALDPFPYSGGLTTCEALWMGVPTVTVPGLLFAARHSASHLCNAGLADWVAGSLEDYVALAVARAADIGGLTGLRTGLRRQVRQSPLCDAPRFGRSLGAALRTTWRAWCEGAPS